MTSKDSKNTRRDFLKKLGLIGAGTAVTGAAIYAGLDLGKTESGKKISLLTKDNELVEVDETAITSSKVDLDLEALQARGRTGLAGKRFVMVIDLNKCKNARKCIKACQNAHQLKPDQFHINVLEMEHVDGKTGTFHMPKPCMHCDNPPCVPVCPVNATFKRQDGIVLIDNERCIGCRFCVAACPYSARVFNWTEPRDAEKFAGQEYDMELNVPQKKGTISKCLFSADQLREDKLPYCVSACPNGTYYFGDENEDAVTNGTTKETVRLSTLLKENNAYTLMPELGTKPRVYYLPKRG